MATVPQYSLPTVQSNPLPNVRQSLDVNPSMFGAGEAQVLQQTGAKLDTLATRMAFYGHRADEENDRAAVKNALNQLDSFTREALYGSATLDESGQQTAPGYYSKVGSDALNGLASFKGSVEERQKALFESLTNDRQKALFADASNQHKASVFQGAHSFAHKQNQVYLDGVSAATIDNSIQNGVAFYGDQEQFDRSYAAGKAETIAILRRNGLVNNKEIYDSEMRKYDSKFHSAVIDRLINDGNPAGARDYFNKVKGSLSPESFHRNAKAVESGNIKVDAQRVVDEVTGGTVSPDGTTGMDSVEGVAQRIASSNVEGTGKNPMSSAQGTGQFIDSTWIDIVSRNRPDLVKGKSRQEILDMRNDASLGLEMTKRYAAENADKLRRAGLTVDSSSLYLAHFLGPDGAIKALKAGDATPIAEAVSPEAIAANPGVFNNVATVGDLRGWSAGKMGDTQYADRGGALLPLDVYLDRVRSKIPADKAELREAAENRVVAWHARMEKGIADRRDSFSKGVTAKIEGGKTFNDLSPEEQQQAENYGMRHNLVTLQNQIASGKRPPKDSEDYMTIYGERFTDPVKFGQYNFNSPEMAAKLHPDDRQKLMAMQHSDEFKQGKFSAAFNLTAPAMKQAYVAMYGPTNKAQLASFTGHFQSSLVDEMGAEEKRIGRALNQKEILDIAGKMLARGTIVGPKWYDFDRSNAPRFLTTAPSGGNPLDSSYVGREFKPDGQPAPAAQKPAQKTVKFSDLPKGGE